MDYVPTLKQQKRKDKQETGTPRWLGLCYGLVPSRLALGLSPGWLPAPMPAPHHPGPGPPLRLSSWPLGCLWDNPHDRTILPCSLPCPRAVLTAHPSLTWLILAMVTASITCLLICSFLVPTAYQEHTRAARPQTETHTCPCGVLQGGLSNPCLPLSLLRDWPGHPGPTRWLPRMALSLFLDPGPMTPSHQVVTRVEVSVTTLVGSLVGSCLFLARPPFPCLV